ncbi:MAG: transposase [Chloroflexota bacterium]|nr:MAG: transposase [Chloroflexota bacterium]
MTKIRDTKSSIVEVRRTYKYRLYRSKRDFRLHDTINISGIIWNHLTALQKRYYRLTGKHISENRMKAHIARLRMKTTRFAHWRLVGSQAVQDICERHEKVYDNFFEKKGGLPRFKKVKKYTSFTLKQAGWTLHEAEAGKRYRRITIDGTVYKFVYHRPIAGVIKTVTIKRDAAGRLWVCFSVLEKLVIEDGRSTGEIGAFDFGLKTFLVTADGQHIENPLFFQHDLPRLRQIQAQVSKKKVGSINQKEGQRHIARRHIRIADKRRDFHFQLAHDLCDGYDTLIFEDLNLAGMKALWGRKVSDLGFAQFLKLLEWVAFKRGKQVVIIDRFERTTGKCSGCGHEQAVTLAERIFVCDNCGLTLDRDHNAALNILEAGRRLILSQSEEVPVTNGASGAHGSFPHL